ncbi:hypothetical protein [Sphingorhabdus sp. SMR4y]|uniref:hypothetical protein n=1 Tax=Sphingorhabdus sp. SMR4y TaxID=2584094 RepID=UPI000B5CEC18|nr:hypothetical protein [Sphingorhabdus sp. SMR4y]ASK88671.1 hypothetical protein SPHFLASMR4Y_01925 [Sphingorhabdus sp. SMR4y]
MIRKILTISALSLATLACSETTRVEDDLSEAQTDLVNPTGREARQGADPAEKPVRIGEGGPRFDACQAVGRVQGLRGGTLPVRIAPFDAAKQKAEIGEGQQLWICTRSHDQQWFGIVYDDGVAESIDDTEANGSAPAASNGSVDCGVSSPVRAKRNYDGPCKSGWVESTYVKLVAG